MFLIQEGYCFNFDVIDFLKIMDKLNIDFTIKEVDWLEPGESAASSTFDSILKVKITGYDEKRNDPNLNHLSNISPYLHYGNISSQRLVFELSKPENNNDIDAFIEQILVRKELADNFCYYNKNYDNFLFGDEVFLILLIPALDMLRLFVSRIIEKNLIRD